MNSQPQAATQSKGLQTSSRFATGRDVEAQHNFESGPVMRKCAGFCPLQLRSLSHPTFPCCHSLRTAPLVSDVLADCFEGGDGERRANNKKDDSVLANLGRNVYQATASSVRPCPVSNTSFAQ